MSIVQRLFAGGPARISRLHDADGNMIGLSQLGRNGPKAFATGVSRLAFGKRPDIPWISYDAQKIISEKLTRSSRILEFGSGMSTAWWARRSGEVIAVETLPEWHRIVINRLAAMGIKNAQVLLAPTRAEYLDLPRSFQGDGFDLIMVDGEHREYCIDAARDWLRPGGMIYLDNSDVGVEPKKRLTRLAAERGATSQFFTDFAPTMFFVQQGMLCTFP